MAVERRDVLASPDTPRFLDGAVFLSATPRPWSPEDPEPARLPGGQTR